MALSAPRPRILLALLLVSMATPGGAQEAARKALDHDSYDIWNRVSTPALSHDGRWALYGITSEANDPSLTVTALAGGATHSLERAEGPRFDFANRFVAFTIRPSKEAVKQARQRRTPAAQLPPDTLGILDLQTGTITRVARLRSFRMPDDAGAWLAYQLGRAPAERTERPDSARPAPGAVPPQRVEPGRMPEPPVGEAQDSARRPAERRREEGYPMVVRNLATGAEHRVEDVVTYAFSDDGTRLVYTRSDTAGNVDGVYVMNTQSGASTALATGKGEYKQVAFDDTGRQVAFIANVDEFAQAQPSWKLYHWDGRATAARVIAAPTAAGIPQGFWIADATLRFSPNGQRIFFGTAPRPAPEPARNDDPTVERVVVDIWNWKDPLIQPMQLRQADAERRRTYEAVVHLREGRVVQLARPDLPNVAVALRGDGDFAIGTSNLPYRQATSWGEGGSDVYLVDARTGEATMLLEYSRSSASLSPEGKYLTWFDGDRQAWFLMDLKDRTVRNISEQIPVPVYNELHDSPSLPGSYGSAGWTTGDTHFLVYDRFDIWAVDPTGRTAPRSITEGTGRRDNLRFRYVRLDPEERAIHPDRDMLLSAFNLWTKHDGFYRDRVSGPQPPLQLVMEPKRFGTPRRARDADVLMLTRSDFQEFPDVWIADRDLRNMRRLSNANPQQAQYRWGTSELVDWRSADGDVLQGVLYKPEGFDPSKQYPMMVYFYERLSDQLNGYVIPAAGSSSINISFYVSRGYLVFTPDIPYRIGYPGESAFKAVVPGVLSLVARGFVDDKRIGVQGHSWGGYQISYLITKTDIFRAAEAGAPVANMISAYGGIRWESGMSRMFQYEKTQSRLGATLWDSPMRFIENSPIFWADKVNTPLLMMHNDEDGAVPWEQGIEYFVALRRLGKPVWMLNYNGEAHGLRNAANRKDWTTRMQQFFDHYLMDAPPPVWLEHGVPAVDKGKNLGLDLVTKPITSGGRH
ncbi:MAG TPA: prolyl oligopeptidase family serine peptidase [Longimicrobiales bacterium]|nr:prolyl oligopeptidase family serine peptidase [Longimicrobiales bacterium]